MKRNTIVVLVGESASGKSTLEKMATQTYSALHKIVSYTTRPCRNGEQNDVDYRFCSESEFKYLDANDTFIESAEYRGWHYGSAKKDYIDGEDHIVVLTPHGCRQLKKWAKDHPEINVISFYIKVDRRSRLIKILERGDDIDESYRRNISDVGQFDGFSDEADCVITNHRFTKSKEEIFNEFSNALYDKLIKF